MGIGAGGIERLRSPAASDAFAARYQADAEDPACREEFAIYQVGWADADRAARAQAPDPTSGNWINANDVERLTRSLDVALNGDGAAPQASLCDVVGQVKAVVQKLGRPLLAPAAVEPVAWTPGPNEFKDWCSRILRAGR